MRKVVLDDILGLSAYEKVRQEYRQKIIDLKKKRRISIGNKISLVFENRDTVIFQIQEMLRAERVSDLDKIRDEITVYNELIPAPSELSATLFIEIEDQTNLRDDLLKFLGIDETVYLQVGDQRVQAAFEQGRSKEDKISAVQYVRFQLNPKARKAFLDGEPVSLSVEHENYKASCVLTAEAHNALAADLMDA